MHHYWATPDECMSLVGRQENASLTEGKGSGESLFAPLGRRKEPHPWSGVWVEAGTHVRYWRKENRKCIEEAPIISALNALRQLGQLHL